MTSTEEKKVGLLGGTFDPVHLGHIKAAQEIRRILGLNKVLFIPSFIPPHKNPGETTPPDHRLKMLELALEPYPYFEISTFELDKEGTSYTIDTLRHFTSEEPHTGFYFIVGSELFETIDTWKNYNDLFKLANFAVIERPGFSDEDPSSLPLAIEPDFRYYMGRDDVKIFKNKFSKEIAFTHIQGVRVSSTEIRHRLRSGESIIDLVPEDVESYITRNGLYTGVGS